MRGLMYAHLFYLIKSKFMKLATAEVIKYVDQCTINATWAAEHHKSFFLFLTNS